MAYSSALAREFLRRRLELGLSQDELKQKAGLGSQNLVSMLERNVTEKPSMEDLVRLGKVFRMTPNEIAEVAGWWYPDKEPKLPRELDDFVRGIMDLNPTDRRQLLEMVRKLLQAFRVAEQQSDAVQAAAPRQR